MVTGKELTFTFGIFLYIFVLIGRTGFEYFLLAIVITIILFVASQRVSRQLKRYTIWQDLLKGERFILINTFTIIILILPIAILEENTTYVLLAQGLRNAGLRVMTRALGIALVGWVGNAVMGRGVANKFNFALLNVNKPSDRQLVSYIMVFPAEAITILIYKKTFIQWILQAIWLDMDYSFMGEFILLGIGILLLLWGRMNLHRREAKIASRVQIK